MRQVPQYLILGDGRLARHMLHYLQLQGLAPQQWSRRQQSSQALRSMLAQATHILLLVSDHAIEGLLSAYHDAAPAACWIHCSALVEAAPAVFAHPMQSFASQLYTHAAYQAIPFCIAEDGPAWSECLPGLPNPHYRIAGNQRAFYHAQCVLANNFTCLIWQAFIRTMAETFGIAQADCMPFMQATFNNLQQQPEHALTGPIARQDWAVLARNAMAMRDTPMDDIFQVVIKRTLTEEQWDEYQAIYQALS